MGRVLGQSCSAMKVVVITTMIEDKRAAMRILSRVQFGKQMRIANYSGMEMYANLYGCIDLDRKYGDKMKIYSK